MAMPRNKFPTKEKFMDFIIPITESGCWIWMRGCNKNSYGVYKVENRQWYAHRLSYILFKGNLSNNELVLHKCDTPSCINPNHLFLGTHKDNNIDRDKKKRGVNSRKQYCKYGHSFSNNNTRHYIYPNGQKARFCKLCQLLKQRQRNNTQNPYKTNLAYLSL